MLRSFECLHSRSLMISALVDFYLFDIQKYTCFKFFNNRTDGPIERQLLLTRNFYLYSTWKFQALLLKFLIELLLILWNSAHCFFTWMMMLAMKFQKQELGCDRNAMQIHAYIIYTRKILNIWRLVFLYTGSTLHKAFEMFTYNNHFSKRCVFPCS